MFDFLWDLSQHREINRNRDRVRDVRRGVHRTRSTVRDLEDRIERLNLVCCAMWELLRRKTSLTEQDLLDKIRDLDLQDGQADGKIRRQYTCPSCQRSVHPRHPKCLYCNEPIEKGPFDAV